MASPEPEIRTQEYLRNRNESEKEMLQNEGNRAQAKEKGDLNTVTEQEPYQHPYKVVKTRQQERQNQAEIAQRNLEELPDNDPMRYPYPPQYRLDDKKLRQCMEQCRNFNAHNPPFEIVGQGILPQCNVHNPTVLNYGSRQVGRTAAGGGGWACHNDNQAPQQRPQRPPPPPRRPPPRNLSQNRRNQQGQGFGYEDCSPRPPPRSQGAHNFMQEDECNPQMFRQACAPQQHRPMAKAFGKKKVAHKKVNNRDRMCRCNDQPQNCPQHPPFKGRDQSTSKGYLGQDFEQKPQAQDPSRTNIYSISDKCIGPSRPPTPSPHQGQKVLAEKSVGPSVPSSVQSLQQNQSQARQFASENNSIQQSNTDFSRGNVSERVGPSTALPPPNRTGATQIHSQSLMSLQPEPSVPVVPTMVFNQQISTNPLPEFTEAGIGPSAAPSEASTLPNPDTSTSTHFDKLLGASAAPSLEASQQLLTDTPSEVVEIANNAPVAEDSPESQPEGGLEEGDEGPNSKESLDVPGEEEALTSTEAQPSENSPNQIPSAAEAKLGTEKLPIQTTSQASVKIPPETSKSNIISTQQSSVSVKPSSSVLPPPSKTAPVKLPPPPPLKKINPAICARKNLNKLPENHPFSFPYPPHYRLNEKKLRQCMEQGGSLPFETMPSCNVANPVMQGYAVKQAEMIGGVVCDRLPPPSGGMMGQQRQAPGGGRYQQQNNFQQKRNPYNTNKGGREMGDNCQPNGREGALAKKFQQNPNQVRGVGRGQMDNCQPSPYNNRNGAAMMDKTFQQNQGGGRGRGQMQQSNAYNNAGPYKNQGGGRGQIMDNCQQDNRFGRQGALPKNFQQNSYNNRNGAQNFQPNSNRGQAVTSQSIGISCNCPTNVRGQGQESYLDRHFYEPSKISSKITTGSSIPPPPTCSPLRNHPSTNPPLFPSSSNAGTTPPKLTDMAAGPSNVPSFTKAANPQVSTHFDQLLGTSNPTSVAHLKSK